MNCELLFLYGTNERLYVSDWCTTIQFVNKTYEISAKPATCPYKAHFY